MTFSHAALSLFWQCSFVALWPSCSHYRIYVHSRGDRTERGKSLDPSSQQLLWSVHLQIIFDVFRPGQSCVCVVWMKLTWSEMMECTARVYHSTETRKRSGIHSTAEAQNIRDVVYSEVPERESEHQEWMTHEWMPVCLRERSPKSGGFAGTWLSTWLKGCFYHQNPQTFIQA